MKLEFQVVSLDLAKRLKELGVKQESLFYWTEQDSPAGGSIWQLEDSLLKTEQYSAFTVAELGMLIEPCSKVMLPQFHTTEHIWFCPGLECTESDTEADARAKMLVYLLENKLIASGP